MDLGSAFCRFPASTCFWNFRNILEVSTDSCWLLPCALSYITVSKNNDIEGKSLKNKTVVWFILSMQYLVYGWNYDQTCAYSRNQTLVTGEEQVHWLCHQHGNIPHTAYWQLLPDKTRSTLITIFVTTETQSWIKWKEEIGLFADMIYFGITTLSGIDFRPQNNMFI
jgi:hypothetical protein